MFRFTGNPAHIIGFNSEATKTVKVDSLFANYRTDTDITLQIVSKGFGLLLFVDKFSYNHSVPISYKDKETKQYKLISENENSTNDRNQNEWEKTEIALANKWGLKLNKRGRALYEQFVRKMNVFHPLNSLEEKLEPKVDILKLMKEDSR